jgi:serine/threonine protein kinase
MTATALKMDIGGDGTSSDELCPGTKLLLGQFTIESFINAGGFGIVYIARNSLDRKVVIKECFPSSYCRRIGTSVGARSRAQQDEFRSVVQLFLQEAITLSLLNHPNIVKVHQVFEDNETAYMAMDYIEGPDLLQTVEGEAPRLSPDEITAFLHKMLDAIGYVHSQGLLHRDISPDNILLDKITGQPVLIDFGASRKEVNRKSRALSGLRVVKDGYSPQEFYVSGSKQAPFSDLYALAATFYNLISGETPKTSQERLSAIAGREGDPLRPLAGRFAAYPIEFLRAVDKAMSVFPRDRLQSVDEWRAMLNTVPAQPVPTNVLVAPAAVVLEPAQSVRMAAATEITTAAASAAASAPESVSAPIPAPALVAKPVHRSDAEPKSPTSVPMPVHLLSFRKPRYVLHASAAAILVLVGLISWGYPVRQDDPATPPVSASATAGPEALGNPDTGPVTNLLRLPSGLTFEIVEKSTGTQTIVAEVPDGVATDLEVGDIILFYAASGETLGTSTALREILVREFNKGASTYSFVIRRGASTLDAELRLEVSG